VVDKKVQDLADVVDKGISLLVESFKLNNISPREGFNTCANYLKDYCCTNDIDEKTIDKIFKSLCESTKEQKKLWKEHDERIRKDDR